VIRWSWRARRDEKKIFGLEGQEDVQQV
jgi:hypothetical protein